MRSLRAVRLLQNSTRPSLAVSSRTLRWQIIRKGYCERCEPTPTPTSPPVSTSSSTSNNLDSTKNPPTPSADHRQLGIDQELFITSIYSPGSPIFLPNGARIFNKLVAFLRSQYARFGFEEVITPTIYKKSLWEKSGHWENYAEDMYSVTGRGATGRQTDHQPGEDEEYGLKPMNCPGHCLIFASRPRSYRELPIRYADFSPLHRNEISGALTGLTRVRRFHQDDGHIFCRPSQIREEISKTLEFVRMAYQVLGLGPYRLALSTRPKDSYIGTMEEWDNAEAALKESLDASGTAWELNEGDGAFYGPKIDIILKDKDGKEHQTATIQLDFQLPKRFELEYQAPAPELEQKDQTCPDVDLLAEQGLVTPVLIHRAILGSVERIMALLIEHHNGRWPLWLSPRQVCIITVNDEPAIVAMANEVKAALQPEGQARGSWVIEPTNKEVINPISTPDGKDWAVKDRPFINRLSVDIDATPRSVKKKISEAKRKRYSVIIVLGKDNVESGRINVDLSGIPDPLGVYQSSHYVSSTLASMAHASRNAKNGMKGKDIWQGVKSGLGQYTTPQVGLDGQTQDEMNGSSHLLWELTSEPTVATTKELQNLVMTPNLLRAFLLNAIRAYQ